MPKEKGGKYPFVCGGCGWAIHLLPSPMILVNGIVKPKITHRCEACEEKGRIAKGDKQIFYHRPDAPEPAREELVIASAKYV